MIKEMRNGTAVKRFHTTTRIREETVGHHSCNVALLILRLEPECSKQLLELALKHDLIEQYTGDLPAPFKWTFPRMSELLTACEDVTAHRTGLELPIVSSDELSLLKTADTLDCMFSCLEEMRMGNQYARELYIRLMARLQDTPNYGLYESQIETMIQELRSGDQWSTEWQQTTSK